ncbi:MAG: acyltransferase family protein [Parvibaculaceae bacterium]|nr:acyltransferase family protein [Parvibaculaceae bacterium]
MKPDLTPPEQSAIPVPATPPTRINWIDATKGLTIMMVVTMHIALGTQTMMGGADMWLVDFTNFVRPFRVPLFFIIAGLFAAKALQVEWRKFFDSKILHFAYFYFLWASLQLGIKLALPGEGNHALSLSDFWLLPFEPFATLWFIYALALFFLVVRLTRALHPAFMLAFALLLYAADVHTGWTAIDEFSGRVIFFLAGLHASRFVLDFAQWTSLHKMAALSITVLGLLAVFVLQNNVVLEPRIDQLCAAFYGAAAVIAFMAAFSTATIMRPFTYVGERSLSVYLAFFLPGAILRIGLAKTGWFNDGDIIAAIAIAGGVIVPLVGAWALSKTPLAFLFIRPKMFRLGAKKIDRTPAHEQPAPQTA